ncbi:MAG: hypothetical protein NTV19_02950, partial [Burkholderiales bacterium]|nr:hypothetical protein [Burkholderiales bacterium]
MPFKPFKPVHPHPAAPPAARPVAPDSMAGLPLVETMIVRAVIGSLGVTAFSAYRNEVMRSRWATVVAALGGAKVAMTECVMTRGAANCDWNAQLIDGQLGLTSLPPGIRVRAANFGTGTGLRIDGDARYGKCAIGMMPVLDSAGGRAVTRWGGLTGGGVQAVCDSSQTGLGEKPTPPPPPPPPP